MSLGSWIVEVLKTPGGAAAVSACAALSGASLTARVQTRNHREAASERQEDKLREAVADVLAIKSTWPNSFVRLGSVIAYSGRSTAEGEAAFKTDYRSALEEFRQECVELGRRVERVRLLTRHVKVLAALGQLDELTQRGVLMVNEVGSSTGQDRREISERFLHFVSQMGAALTYLSDQTQRLTARHGLDDAVQPDDDLSRKTVRKYRKRAQREGTAYVTTTEAEMPCWKYYPSKLWKRISS